MLFNAMRCDAMRFKKKKSQWESSEIWRKRDFHCVSLRFQKNILFFFWFFLKREHCKSIVVFFSKKIAVRKQWILKSSLRFTAIKAVKKHCIYNYEYNVNQIHLWFFISDYTFHYSLTYSFSYSHISLCSYLILRNSILSYVL